MNASMPAIGTTPLYVGHLSLMERFSFRRNVNSGRRKAANRVLSADTMNGCHQFGRIYPVPGCPGMPDPFHNGRRIQQGPVHIKKECCIR